MDGKDFWNARARYYMENNESVTFPPALTLSNMLDIYNAENVLEVACASGLFSVYFLGRLQKTKKFISVDVSNTMIRLAEERKADAKGLNEKIDHQFIVGNATELDLIQDASIDVYVSNLCIHLVSNQVKFLEEARRVLKKDGKIGLTVPRREGGYMDLLMRNFQKVDALPPVSADLWFLGNKGAMISLLQDNGFKVQYCWEDHFKLPITDEQDIDFQLNHGDAKSLYAPLSDAKKREVRQNILDDFHAMKRSFDPFQMKLISIIAVKAPVGDE